MLSPEQAHQVRPRLMMIQVICGALIMGMVVFTGILCAVLVDIDNLNPSVKMLTMIGAVAGILLYGISFILPRLFTTLVTAKGKDQESVERNAITAIANALTMENIARYAMLEAGVFLNAVVMILEPHLWTICVVGLGLFFMIVLFPLPGRMLSQVEDRLREFRERRELRG